MLLSATVFGMGPFGVLEVYLARAPSQRNKTCTRTCLVDALFCSRHSEEAGVAGSDSFSTVVTMFQQSVAREARRLDHASEIEVVIFVDTSPWWERSNSGTSAYFTRICLPPEIKCCLH